MNNEDLIVFNSPQKTELKPKVQTGNNNPFDDALNMASSPYFGQAANTENFNNDLMNFLNGNVERESLGILDLSKIDIDSGRPSIGVLIPKLDFSQLLPTAENLNNAFIESRISPFLSTITPRDNNNQQQHFTYSPNNLQQLKLTPENVSNQLNVGFMETMALYSPFLSAISPYENSRFTYTQFSNSLKSVISPISPSENNKKCKNEVEINEQDDNIKMDYIYCEAKHLASRIENGSIFDDSLEGPNILDDTREPKEFEKLDHYYDVDDETPPIINNNNNDKKAIIKSVDRLIKKNEKTSPKEISIKSNFNSKENLSNLSEISKINKGESGYWADNSSLSDNNYEILDLSTKSLQSNQPLDLSMNKKKNEMPKKRLSQSFTFAQPKSSTPPPLPQQPLLPSVGQTKKLTKINSINNSSGGSGDSIKNSFNFKSRKMPDIKQRGPMKATAKLPEINKTKTTPKKRENSDKSKNTSTPINNYRMKPVAQSTPDGIGAKRPIVKSSPKLNYTSSRENSINKSSLTQKSLNESYNKQRSFSLSNTKGDEINNFRPRSYSMGTPTKTSIPQRGIINKKQNKENISHNF